MANKFDINVGLPPDAELERMFNFAPRMEKKRLVQEVVEAGSSPIVVEAKALAPRGDMTGTSARRSKSQRDEANWEYPLWKSIATVVRKYKRGGVAIVGPRWPEGNKAYFNTSPKGRREVLWGKPTGRVVAQVRNWIVQAFDSTRQQQLEAMKNKMTELLDQIMRDKANG